MHAKILFPLKIRRRTLLTHPPSATDAMSIRAAAGCSDTAGVDVRQLVSYRSHMTKPIRLTGRNLVCVGNCICLTSITARARGSVGLHLRRLSFMATELPEERLKSRI